MAGELNGTDVVIADGTGTIVGQMEATLTFNGTPIDISNKSTGDFVALLDGELAGKQLQLAGTFVYNSDARYQAMKAASLTGTQDTYTVTYGNGEVFSATMVPNGLSEPLPHGDKVSTSITLLSSGVVTHTPQT